MPINHLTKQKGDVMNTIEIAEKLARGKTINRKELGSPQRINLIINRLKYIQENCQVTIKQLKEIV